MSYEAWNKKLAKCSELRAAGTPIWYSRWAYTDPAWADAQTKWHVFKDRKQSKEGEYGHIWVALCGYQHKFYEVLLETPRLKLGKAKPPVKDRCTKCAAKLAKQAKRSPLRNPPGTM